MVVHLVLLATDDVKVVADDFDGERADLHCDGPHEYARREARFLHLALYLGATVVVDLRGQCRRRKELVLTLAHEILQEPVRLEDMRIAVSSAHLHLLAIPGEHIQCLGPKCVGEDSWNRAYACEDAACEDLGVEHI